MHGHRHGAQIALFTGGPDRGEQRFRVLGALRTDAEHLPAPPAVPVGIGKTGPGERRFQRLPLRGSGSPVLIQEPGIDGADDGHILRPLHPALQFQTADAHLPHLPEIVGETVVLQAQGIAPFAAVHAVGQTAGLGTAAPVAGAAAHYSAHFALAGVAHAEGPVDENLNFRRTGLADGPGVLPGALPCQHHPLTAIRGGLTGASGGENAHLGAGVKRQVRQNPPQNIKKTPVLHQDGVHAQTAGRPCGLHGVGQFPVGHQGIQCEKDPDSPGMTIDQSLRELLIGEVFGAPAGIERTPAQVHGIRSALHRKAEGLRGPGWCQKFRSHAFLFRASSFCCSRNTSRFSSLTSAWALLASSR